MNSADSKTVSDMDERTLTALEGSIAKWQAIVDGTGLDKGADNCPLCNEFSNVSDADADGDEAWRSDGCDGCPVSEKAGTSSCGRTPYEEWSAYVWDHRNKGAGVERESGGSYFDYRVFDARSKELAQAELDFLKSLLPLAATSERP